jgi:hypothetical protein
MHPFIVIVAIIAITSSPASEADSPQVRYSAGLQPDDL